MSYLPICVNEDTQTNTRRRNSKEYALKAPGLALVAGLSLTSVASASLITYVDAATANTTLADGTAYTPTAITINMYAYFWAVAASGNSDWDLAAGLTSGSLTDYKSSPQCNGY